MNMATCAFDEAVLGPDGWETEMRPRKTPYILAQVGTPIGIAPTGTMAANGDVTLGTALNTTYSGGLWLYFPSGAVYAGSVAGFFWCVMSSTTLGTVYDNTYTPGTDSWDIPASPTAIVAAGPGAFTGVTSEITAVSVTLPGGSLGDHGGLTVSYRDARINNAGNKTVSCYLGGTLCIANNAAPNGASFSLTNTLQNQGRQNRQQEATGVSDTVGVSTTAPAYRSIDTSIDRIFAVTITRATATDYAIMFRLMVTVSPS